MSRRSARGKRLAAALAGLAALGACREAPPLPSAELQIRLETPAAEVELGRAFPLAVVRLWSQKYIPADFSEQLLQPLAVSLEGIERREERGRVEETRRYRAFAFTLEEVVLEGLVLQAYPRDGGPPAEALSNALRLPVRPALDPQQPGPPELPRAPFPARVPWPPVAGAAALALSAGLLHWRRTRARLRAPAAPPPRPPAHAAARARLERLAAGAAAPDEAGIQAFHVEAAGLLRDYLEERFEACRPELTSEEFLASPRAAEVLAAGQREGLARFLAACDLVKFARAPSTPEERAGLLAWAEAFLLETRPPEAQA